MKTWGAEKCLEWLLFLTGNKKKKRYLKGKKISRFNGIWDG